MHRYHADQVGSTVALTDASGAVTDRWSYSPFGTEFRVSGNADTPFRFNGAFGVMTEASGLVYMRTRYYHPRLMRFLNADPIGFGGGLNWYAFADNSPTLCVDPLGLWQVTITGGYGYGVSLSFGRNSGQTNVSIAAGIGLGLAAEFNPNDNSVGNTGKAEVSQSLTLMGSIGAPALGEVGGRLDAGVAALSEDMGTTFIGTQATGGMSNMYLGGVSSTWTGGVLMTKDSVDTVNKVQSNGWNAQAGGVLFAGYNLGFLLPHSATNSPQKTKPAANKMEDDFGRIVIMKPFTVSAKRK